jgi:hypothetical protein
MKRLIGTLLIVGGFAQAAQAACDYPIAPGKFPDGSQATKQEMLDAKGQVVKYNEQMTAYLECIKSEFEAKLAGQANVTPEQRAEMERLHGQKETAAVEEVTAVTERFNEQLRVWKARSAEKKGS